MTARPSPLTAFEADQIIRSSWPDTMPAQRRQADARSRLADDHRPLTPLESAIVAATYLASALAAVSIIVALFL